MGALVSLFVSLISLVVSLFMSLFMTLINLLASALRGSVRASAPRRGSRRPFGALGGFVLLTLVVLIILAAAPRATVVVGLFVLAVLLARRLLGGPRTPKAQELAQRLEAIRAMSGTQFEVFIADLFRAMGHNAQVLGGSGDQGVDVIVDYKGERVAVQCKNYSKAVGNKPVQEVYAGSRFYGCNNAWVVAPAGFTKGAVELARRVGVTLYDARARASSFGGLYNFRCRRFESSGGEQSATEAGSLAWIPDDPRRYRGEPASSTGAFGG